MATITTYYLAHRRLALHHFRCWIQRCTIPLIVVLNVIGAIYSPPTTTKFIVTTTQLIMCATTIGAIITTTVSTQVIKIHHLAVIGLTTRLCYP